MPYKDPEKQNAAVRCSYHKHQDQRREYSRKYYRANKQRYLDKHRAWRAKNPKRDWHNRIQYRWGISSENYEEMLRVQGGGCAICGKPPDKIRLAIDHNHKTGRIRGLLCHGKGRCNWVLGILERTGLLPLEQMGSFGTYLLSESRWPWIVPDRKKKRKRKERKLDGQHRPHPKV